jgi:SAM-dependent methyltransferase
MDEVVEQVRAQYDAVPYESHAFFQSAPGHIAAIAHLFGLDPPPVSRARVLEIGCSAGGNLIPFAAWHPQAEVVGIDLSQVEIDKGTEDIRALGLPNLTLQQGDIAATDLDDLGKFDYIICHGVYSWVPANVQEAILSACHALLAHNGVAYVSYNTYPGWKAKEIVRDAMMLRGGDRGTPEEKLSYARGMIDFLNEVSQPDSILAKALADFDAIRVGSKDYYLLHEYLEMFNAPCYFLDFGKRCDPHFLSYLADASPPIMFALNYGNKVSQPLLEECGHSQVLVEQYLDFVVNRTFRQSLLVHADCAPQISYQIDRKRFSAMHFAGWLPPTSTPTVLDHSTQQFGHDATLFTPNPGVKAALDALTTSWPWTMSHAELLDTASTRLAAAGIDVSVDHAAKIDELLEALIMRGMARYRLDPVSPPEPATPPLRLEEPVRRMAELVRWHDGAPLFNRWHEAVTVAPVDRHLLPLLTGERDVAELAQELLGLALRDIIRFERDGARLLSEADLRAAATEYVSATPRRLAEMKLI